MEPYEKIYVSAAFLSDAHGQIGCTACHNGDPESSDWQTAHRGIVKDPTYPDPEKACGKCHPEVAASAAASLHYSIAPIGLAIKKRMGAVSAAVQSAMDDAGRKHCSQCHASCGQCHISRPDYVNGGFLAQHRFQKTPPMETTCASCHGGRVFGEFTGLNAKVPADTHFKAAEMTCMDCHNAAQIHAPAKGITTRFQTPRRPRCENCHTEAAGGEDSKTHQTHQGRVACQVCHARAVKNCYGCHVGTDAKGLTYYKNSKTVLDFKIGRNPAPTPNRPYSFVVVRHPPIVPETFDHYVKRGLAQFDAAPTWKLDAPHTIQRLTPQNSACNNCHGNRQLFLSPSDLAAWEVGANAGVVVSDDTLPRAIAASQSSIK